MEGKVEILRYEKYDNNEAIKIMYINKHREYILEVCDRILLLKLRVSNSNVVYEKEERIVFSDRIKYLSDLVNDLKNVQNVEDFYYALEKLKKAFLEHLKIRKRIVKERNIDIKTITKDDKIERTLKNIPNILREIISLINIINQYR